MQLQKTINYYKENRGRLYDEKEKADGERYALLQLEYDMICIFLIQLEDLQNQEAWYSAEEMRRYLKTNKYSDEIANELCDQYADNLQKAYEKGLSRQKIKEEHMLHFGTYMPICDYGDFLCKLDDGEFEVLNWSNEYGIYQETWTKGEEDFTERVIAFIDLPA